MTQSITTSKGAVYLVDDDAAVRRGVAALLVAADYTVSAFNSAESFLSELGVLNIDNAALLVDICMPGIQGLELQERLRHDGVHLPVIVMTAHGDIAMAVRAMRNGAVDFLEKPFTVDEIMMSLERALTVARPIVRLTQCSSPELNASFKSLTPRECEVLREVVGGNTNKEIARALSVSPRTVEVHRQNIMAKMHAKSFAELVRMAVALDIGD